MPSGADGVAALTWRLRALGWPKLAISLLSVLLALEALWLIVQAVRPLPSGEISRAAASTAETSTVLTATPELPSLSESASPALFGASAASTAPDAFASPRPALSGSAKLLGSRLTLTGIVSGEPPQAIIEDTQTQKTYFLVAGQAIEDAVLEQVLENRVILDLHGEKIELNL
jgi:type II secretory pathway component PulC